MKKKKRGNSVNKKLDAVLTAQQRLLKEELRIEREGRKTEKKEEEIESLEKKQLTELQRLERIEKEVAAEVKQHPLTKVTVRDLYRGVIGAFVGTVLHYTFLYGVEIAQQISVTRATIIYFLSFAVGMVFLYMTGFRKIKDSGVVMFLPVRMTVLYVVSIIMSLAVLYLFFPTFGQSFEEAYKQTATVSLSAVLGACTADILGKD